MKNGSMYISGIVAATLFLANALAIWADESPSSPAATTAMPVKIHVDVKETKGRRVEGSVRGHVIAVDQPKEFGADDTAPTPPETLAFALGACVVSTVRYIALLEKLDVRNITAAVDGNIDYARASGLPTPNRAGFGGLTIKVTWDTSLDIEKQRKLLHRAQERCPMCDNLAKQTPFEILLLPHSKETQEK